ncbi:glycoside hydrolase family 68 protein [Ligilactobacillus murinus]|uniref:glycoside hydrolase family 68 protein n=1 Tax=Ligilactobacillus murinus TaxID=1622 RepID=UPI00096F43DF|nr:glycoside hydrolase family 68 protein [Ligilactobacillus murinus]
MKDTIVRKKMYKAGKNWVVASVAVAAMVAGSAKVSADQTTETQVKNDVVETTNKVPETASTYTLKETDSDKGLTQKEVSADATPAKEDMSAQETTNTPKTEVTSETKASTKATDEPAVDAPTVAKETKDEKTSEASNETLAKTSEDKVASSMENTEGAKELDNLAKLNDTAKQIAKEANLDPSKLTDEQIDSLNKVVLDNNAKAGTRLTYRDFQSVAETLEKQDPNYAVPFFNASQIKNMPAAYTKDAQTGEYADLDIWDSWPVQDAKTGQVSDWNGYQLVIAMMGIPSENDSHLYLLYNKYGDNNFANWKNAGPIFGYNATPLRQEWSGSATVNSDGTIQLYYTQVDTTKGTNHQKIASAVLTLDHTNNTVSIAHVDKDHVIFEGDGYHYQTYQQWVATNKGADNVAMRDAHIIENDKGERYLVFEASTGKENYQGEDQIFNWKNYGSSAEYNTKSLFDILGNDDIKSRATWANAAIGILKLNNNEKYPEVAEVYTPLLTAAMVSDEIERPDVVKLGDKYYLFAATRLNRGSNDYAWMRDNYAVGDNVAMLGYVSDELTGDYKPLNGSGVVLTASVPANWRTATYSYYAVPVAGYNDRVLVTAYMTNRGGVAGEGKNSTLAPSFLVKINPDGTTKVLAKVTNQGDWIWDDSSENPDMLGTLDTAYLPGEKDKPVDWDLVGYYLKDHKPARDNDPEKPTTPTPEKPSTPTPEKPTTPEKPFVPEEFIVTDEPTPEEPEVSRSAMLPQAGEKQSPIAMILAGMSALMMSFGLAKTKKRK